uniref:Pleckstrin homology domain containing B1 n=1 Tax=Canis lupus familiaris TaxID=9615 RepID=A0A8P0T242_CANLF
MRASLPAHPLPGGGAGPRGGAQGQPGPGRRLGIEMPQAFWDAQSAGAAGWVAEASSSGRFGSSIRKKCRQVPPDPILESPFEEMALVRGGWLWRQSSILRRWKRNWFALWLDGTLGYYHDETAQDEEDRVLIQFNVRDIKIGQECRDVQPPEGRSRDGLLTVNLREGSRLHLCAETKDDAIAWKTALLEANSTPAPAGATVPPRSRRVCPKVRCVTRSWSPCKVERRIWVSAGSALLASIRPRGCASKTGPGHIPSLLTNIPWLPNTHRAPTTAPFSRASGSGLGQSHLPHPLISCALATLFPMFPTVPDFSPLSRLCMCHSLCCENS